MRVACRKVNMAIENRFHYQPDNGERLSLAVVSAVAKAHHEEVIEQNWIIQNEINPDALDKLFDDDQLNMSLQFEADRSTVTIDADEHGEPVITIESHR